MQLLNLLNLEPIKEEPPKLQLRQYQIDVISQVSNFFNLGKKSVMVYAPTGAGKTVISAQIIADAVKEGQKVLFCCHRQKLIRQTQKTLHTFFDIDSGIIWGKHPSSYDAPVQIAMIQTLQNRELPKNIGLVIFDECHSSVHYEICWDIMKQYSKGIFIFSPCRFIGLTATPWRSKAKEGFCKFFECIVRAPDPNQLVETGYLTLPRLFGYGGLLDFSRLETGENNDYTEASMQKVCNEEYNEEVVYNFMKLCEKRKAIAFCAGVRQAEDLAEQFNEAGAASAVVVGDTPEYQRELIYSRFAKGEIQIISSVGCLCEGFDEPSVEAVIIARPTRSKALLIQMCGRALRLHPGKQDAFILDFGECFSRNFDLRKKLPISLCPREFEPKPTTKECPYCHRMVPTLSQICPECGYEFVGDGKPPTEDGAMDFPVFGEILTPEQLAALRYIRSQMKTKYTKGENPARVTTLFKEKFKYHPPADWFVGAIFGLKNPAHDRQQYANYLRKIRPKAPQLWIDYMMMREFGEAGKTYITQSGKAYVAPSGQVSPRGWWEILEVSHDLDVTKEAGWKIVKQAYWEKQREWLPSVYSDEAIAKDMMMLLNYAFDCAKAARFGDGS